LRQEPIPEMKGKVLVCAAQASNEMVLESTYGTFGGIAAVNVWWDELIVHIFCSMVLLEGSLLLDAQHHNAHVQFTIRPDLIKDLKGLKYHQLEDTDCPTRSVTPFALLKLTDLELWELK